MIRVRSPAPPQDGSHKTVPFRAGPKGRDSYFFRKALRKTAARNVDQILSFTRAVCPGWLARICSISELPDRGMPSTSTGASSGSPYPRTRFHHAAVEYRINPREKLTLPAHFNEWRSAGSRSPTASELIARALSPTPRALLRVQNALTRAWCPRQKDPSAFRSSSPAARFASPLIERASAFDGSNAIAWSKCRIASLKRP